MSLRYLLPIQSLHLFLVISVGTAKARVPWAQIQAARDEFIAPEYLPRNVTLKQYHHLCKKDINSLLEHWIERQAAGKIPLKFKKAAEDIRKNKRTWEEDGTDADTEEELPRDDGNQRRRRGASQGGSSGSRLTGQSDADEGSAEDGRGRSSSSEESSSEGELSPNDKVRNLAIHLIGPFDLVPPDARSCS